MIQPHNINIIGAGGHAKVVISTLQAAGMTVKGIYDDDPGKWGQEVLGTPVLGPLKELNYLNRAPAVLGIGNNRTRKSLVLRFGHLQWVSVIHPTAYVHESAKIGIGTVIFAGAVIQPSVSIGKHCIINTGATVDHDCALGDFVHVAPGVHLAGNVSLDEGVFLGIAASAAPGTHVQEWTTVGAGGVIVHDLPKEIVAVGVPARPLSKARTIER